MLLKHRRWHRCVCVIFFYIYIFGECLVIIVCWRAADLYPVSISRFSNLKIQWLLYTVRPDWLTVFLLSGQKSLRPHFYADRWMRTETFNTDKRLVNRFEEKLCWQCFKKKKNVMKNMTRNGTSTTSYFIFYIFVLFLFFFVVFFNNVQMEETEMWTFWKCVVLLMSELARVQDVGCRFVGCDSTCVILKMAYQRISLLRISWWNDLTLSINEELHFKTKTSMEN